MLFAFGAFASIGLPGFANFWGELAIFVALWKYSPLITALAVSGVVISAVYGLRAASRVFFGPATERMNEVASRQAPSDLRWSERVPALVLLAALLFIGFWPRSLSPAINPALPASPVAAASASR